MKKKALVVGAGFAGAVVARELAESGLYDVLVIDARNHIAGNAYDYVNEHGIRVHKYGPHLWHTNNEVAHNWFSQFTEWLPYKHQVQAQLDGSHVPLPINAQTIIDVFGKEFSDFAMSSPEYWGMQDEESDLEFCYKPRAFEAFIESKQVKHEKITNSREHVEASVGKELCELFFAPYTKKMWGMDLADLPTSVAARIPTKTNFDPYYFPKDKFQGLPKDGYTVAFEKIFDHDSIEVLTSTDRKELMQFSDLNKCVKFIRGWDGEFDAVFTSEPIDTYYNCDLGELPWRSVKMHHLTVPLPQVLPTPTVNFTHDGPHTRVTEWKQLPGHGENPHYTTLTFEEPCDYRDNNMERYYPVKSSLPVDPHRELYNTYRDRAEADGIHFIGRCGTFQYLDMWMVIAQTLKTVEKFIETERNVHRQEFLKEFYDNEGSEIT